MKRTVWTLVSVAALCAAPAAAEDPIEHADEPTSVTGSDASAPATGSDASAPATGSVARATFAVGIADREPIDSVEVLSNDHDRVFFFTELRGLEGQTVVHRWEHEGAVMAEVAFHVGSPRWRVHSSKKLLPGWTGSWSVSVLDEAGDVLAVEHLQYEPVTTAQEVIEVPAPPAKVAVDPELESGESETDTARDEMGEAMWMP